MNILLNILYIKLSFT